MHSFKINIYYNNWKIVIKIIQCIILNLEEDVYLGG